MSKLSVQPTTALKNTATQAIKYTRDNAIKYMLKKEAHTGYMKDLKKAIGKDFVEEFKRVGFISTGYTTKEQTYKVTELGKEYALDLFG